jgi:hypothetical protein
MHVQISDALTRTFSIEISESATKVVCNCFKIQNYLKSKGAPRLPNFHQVGVLTIYWAFDELHSALEALVVPASTDREGMRISLGLN